MEVVLELTGVGPGGDEVSEDAHGGGGGAADAEATEAADGGRRRATLGSRPPRRAPRRGHLDRVLQELWSSCKGCR